MLGSESENGGRRASGGGGGAGPRGGEDEWELERRARMEKVGRWVDGSYTKLGGGWGGEGGRG